MPLGTCVLTMYDEYVRAFWLESTTAHFTFVLLTRLPLPPEWCQDGFFVLRVA